MKIDKSKIIKGNPIPVKQGFGFGNLFIYLVIVGFSIIFIKIARIL